VVKLNIAYFSTPSDGDVLRIYDGSTTSNALIVALTGSVATPLLVQSTQRNMLVSFYTDYSNNSIGFSATYSTATTGRLCRNIDALLRQHAPNIVRVVCLIVCVSTFDE
jgi:hypothetical protein